MIRPESGSRLRRGGIDSDSLQEHMMAATHVRVNHTPSHIPVRLLQRIAAFVLVGFAAGLSNYADRVAISAEKSSVPNIVLMLADAHGFDVWRPLAAAEVLVGLESLT
jgi:hypothetical protein